MKNWFYIPFLVLMALTYTRLAENFDADEFISAATRGPASIADEDDQLECQDYPSQFNPHYFSKNCL